MLPSFLHTTLVLLSERDVPLSVHTASDSPSFISQLPYRAYRMEAGEEHRGKSWTHDAVRLTVAYDNANSSKLDVLNFCVSVFQLSEKKLKLH